MAPTVTNLPTLQSALLDRPESELLFNVDGVKINAGYHVTEIKYAAVKALDCGKGTDEWQEIIIQLLDGSILTSNRTISCAKFLGILNASSEVLDTATDAHLFFEFSPGNNTVQRLQVTSIDSDPRSTVISLNGVKAQCKPFAKAMASARSTFDACCSFALGKGTNPCCGGNSDQPPKCC